MTKFAGKVAEPISGKAGNWTFQSFQWQEQCNTPRCLTAPESGLSTQFKFLAEETPGTPLASRTCHLSKTIPIGGEEILQKETRCTVENGNEYQLTNNNNEKRANLSQFGGNSKI